MRGNYKFGDSIRYESPEEYQERLDRYSRTTQEDIDELTIYYEALRRDKQQ